MKRFSIDLGNGQDTNNISWLGFLEADTEEEAIRKATGALGEWDHAEISDINEGIIIWSSY